MNRICLFAASIVIALPAFAEGPELKDPFEGMQNPKSILRGAQLTPRQVEQILQLRRPGRQKERALENELDASWNEFEARLLADGPPDIAALTQLTQKYDRLSAQLNQLKTQNLFKIRQLLTTEQLASVKEARKAAKSLEQREKDLEMERRELPATIAEEK